MNDLVVGVADAVRALHDILRAAARTQYLTTPIHKLYALRTCLDWNRRKVQTGLGIQTRNDVAAAGDADRHAVRVRREKDSDVD